MDWDAASAGDTARTTHAATWRSMQRPANRATVSARFTFREYTMLPLRLTLPVLLAVVLLAQRGNAQCSQADSTDARSSRRPRRLSAMNDSVRVGSVLGACWGNSSLIRSSVPTADRTPSPHLELGFIDPSLSSTWNSRLPHTLNDGVMWAGRGLTVAASAGFRAEYRRLRLVFVPEIVSAENRPFPILPASDASMSGFASPWHAGPLYADLPLRFGDQRYTRFDPGQSAFEIALPVVVLGATSAASWWGPGTRNALLVSDNAAGIPRIYLRTIRPLSSRIGTVEAEWFVGGLAESPFFDANEINNLRSVSAAVVTLRLAADSGLTVGAARAVYANVRRFGRVPEHLADVFIDWHRPPLDGPVDRTSDQITSLFARWVVPRAGLAAHAEWARVRLPATLRELFVDPQSGQGYTVGLEWARQVSSETTVRAHAEFTTLEQTPDTVGGITPEFYASHSVRQGFTHQGQSVGAAIGPGSSSQNLGVGVMRRAWHFGAELGRIRWQEGAYYRAPSQGRFAWRTHDVSLFAGVSAARDARWGKVEASVVRTLRMNYLFQTPNAFFPDNRTFDIGNTTLSVVLTPRLR